ncbi:cobalt ECF transporter T component CbiQ [Clostridium sp. WILCCON 0269]|uniref:Cobalt ECF transporter T component CbiQ n=1 Tax=Candidatus Clostridium eludens TaxID=3381663 RepID=A0ABW8SNM6_9CLOT
MDISRFSKISDRDTLLHRLDGRVKTVIFLSGIIITTLLFHWYLVVFLWVVTLFAFSILNLPWHNLLTRLIMPFGIAWLVFFSLLFTNGSHILSVIYIGPIHMKAYKEGLQLGTLMLLRIMTAVTMCCVLSFSTPMIEILETLRICKIPGIIVDIADMMYRYVFIIQETAHNMRQAQLSRMAGNLSWVQKARDTGMVAGYVLIKSFDRSVKIYNAMLSRGYTEESITSDYFINTIPKKDLYFGIVAIVLLITLVILNISI